MARKLRKKNKIQTVLGIFVLFFSFSLFFPSLYASNSPRPLDKIASLGLEVLGGEAPIDFTLQEVSGSGKTSSLSDYKGQWIWLVFWATWCSVCKTEMPTLESLFQEFKDKNLTVLGVSVDRDSNAVKRFMKSSSLTFPMLHDPTGKVASQYNATGVPMVYLLSPDWKLVGLARGALNWERPGVLAKVAELVKVKSIANLSGKTATAMADLLPPSLEIIPPAASSLSAKRWPTFEVVVKWPGPSHLYLIKVPRLELPEGVRRGDVSSSSEGHGGHSILKYHFPLFFEEAGTFRIGPIDLSYRPRLSRLASYQTTRHPGKTVEITTTGGLWPTLGLGLSAVVAILAFTGLFFFFKKKRRKRKQGEQEQGREDLTMAWAQALQQAKKHKREGDTKAYCLELFSVCRRIREQHPHLKNRGHDMRVLNKVENLLEGIRYGGVFPQDSEILRMEKIVEWSTNEESWEGG